MSERRAVTKAIATRYARTDRAGKRAILDELCATTGWHRNHARKALGQALRPTAVRPRRPRPAVYGPDVVAALAFCWAVLGAPTGKRLAPVLGDLVPGCAGSASSRSATRPPQRWSRYPRPPLTGGTHDGAHAGNSCGTGRAAGGGGRPVDRTEAPRDWWRL